MNVWCASRNDYNEAEENEDVKHVLQTRQESFDSQISLGQRLVP